MGKMSREKGKRFEREVAAKFREYGYEAARSAQYCGKTGDAPDVIGAPFLHIEAKHQEQMRLYDWLDQAKRDCEADGKGNIPVVIHRQNHKETLVSMRFDDFMKLYVSYDVDNMPFGGGNEQ